MRYARITRQMLRQEAADEPSVDVVATADLVPDCPITTWTCRPR
jgi:hypothetical protein